MEKSTLKNLSAKYKTILDTLRDTGHKGHISCLLSLLNLYPNEQIIPISRILFCTLKIYSLAGNNTTIT